MSAFIEFRGEIHPASKNILVEVTLRGEVLGTIYVDLDQWDDMQRQKVRAGRELDWFQVIANDTKAKAR